MCKADDILFKYNNMKLFTNIAKEIGQSFLVILFMVQKRFIIIAFVSTLITCNIELFIRTNLFTFLFS